MFGGTGNKPDEQSAQQIGEQGEDRKAAPHGNEADGVAQHSAQSAAQRYPQKSGHCKNLRESKVMLMACARGSSLTGRPAAAGR